MDKNTWLKLAKENPKAIKLCSKFFKDHYGDEWKAKMNDPDALEKWFWNRGIKIKVKETNGVFSYEYVIDGHSFQLDPELALIHAIEKAFPYVELREKIK